MRSLWLLPGVMLGISLLALFGARLWPEWSRLHLLIPYTFLGNSLAPLPYDGAVVYLGGRYALWSIVLVAVAGEEDEDGEPSHPGRDEKQP